MHCQPLRSPKRHKDPRFSLAPVGERIAELLGLEVLLFKDYEKEPIDQALQQLGRKQIILLENLRFHKRRKLTRLALLKALLKGSTIILMMPLVRSIEHMLLLRGVLNLCLMKKRLLDV